MAHENFVLLSLTNDCEPDKYNYAKKKKKKYFVHVPFSSKKYLFWPQITSFELRESLVFLHGMLQ